MNRLVNTLKGRWRVFAIVSVALVAVLTGTAQATSPDSTPEPGYAWIDGYISDWDTGISEPPSDINAAWPSGGQWSASVNADSYFADMYRAGRIDKPVESRLWLRYDCSTSTLYALVLAAPGVEPCLQDHGRCDLVDDLAPTAAVEAGAPQRPIRGHRREPLVVGEDRHDESDTELVDLVEHVGGRHAL